MNERLIAFVVMIVSGYIWFKLAKWCKKMDKKNGMDF
jgi:hypothetical protein